MRSFVFCLDQYLASNVSEEMLNEAFQRQLPVFGRHSADDINFQLHFKEWKYLNFDSNFSEVYSLGPIDYIAAMVQIMARDREDDKPLCATMLVRFTDAYMRHSDSMSICLRIRIHVKHRQIHAYIVTNFGFGLWFYTLNYFWVVNGGYYAFARNKTTRHIYIYW